MVQTARADDQVPAARTVSLHELEQRTSEIVRAVHASGEAVDIVEGTAVVARIVPSPPAVPVMDDDAHRIAVRAWLDETETLAQEIARRWPSDVSAVDAVREQRREL